MISLVGFTQNNISNDATTYSVKAKLVKAINLPPGCGILAWAVAQKFEIIKSSIPEINSGFVVVIEPCPEIPGKNFFKKNKIYSISVGRNNNAPFNYVFQNNYEKEKLPTFWSRKINLVVE